MAEVRPFRGLRYDPAKVGDLGSVMCPPYDIITAEDERALRARSPYNVVRAELAIANSEGSYASAAQALGEFRAAGALIQELRPALYLARHEFLFDGVARSRTEVTAAVRLEALDQGVIIPHEATRAREKEDRLHLLRATRTNVSPVMLLYDGEPLPQPKEMPLVADMGGGERFTFWPVTDVNTVLSFTEALAKKPLYIADGHHRYETALNYKRQTGAGPADAASYVMAALISFSDPGLVVLPYHRVFRKLEASAREALKRRIQATCLEKNIPVKDPSTEIARQAQEALAGGALFVLWGWTPGALTVLTLKDGQPIDAIARQGHSRAWAGLANCLFREALLLPALGIHEEEAEVKGLLAFSKDTAEAVQMVDKGGAEIAFLCKAVPFDAFKEVSDKGERLPPKSTFFYPKLPTGLVMKPAEGRL
jgi:uncharacterized protein (DUF1015 family)